MVTRIYKIGSEIWDPPEKVWLPRNSKIWVRFPTTSQRNREYLRKKTRYRRLENGTVNCNPSCSCVLNLVYFGPQRNGEKYAQNFDRPNALVLRGSRFVVHTSIGLIWVLTEPTRNGTLRVRWIIRPPVRSNRRSYKMLVMFLFFQRVISEIPQPIAVDFATWLETGPIL